MPNHCIGSKLVVKFFRNTKTQTRLYDKVYYTHENVYGLWDVVFKEGKYLTLRNTESNIQLVDIKITDVLPKNHNHFITRSIGKIGVIDSKTVQSNMPNDCELWLSMITDEICHGRNSGCFVLTPIRRLSSDNVDRLIPGMFEEKLIDNILYIYPNKLKDRDGDDIYWMLPLTHRKGLENSSSYRNKNFYAIIVELGKGEVAGNLGGKKKVVKY